MSTFALIHGGGDVGWYWHLVEAELRQRGHEVVAPDLPCDDDTAGFDDYANTVVAAIGDRGDLVVVGQSLGGFTVPLVAAKLPTREMIFVAGMIPQPGEAPRDWWADTAYPGPSVDGDTYDMFLHDVPRELAEEALSKGRDQSDARMGEVWPLEKWPDVPSRFILCTEDRFFPPEFLRGVVRERLGVVPEEIAASHCVALSRPKELAAMLDR